MTAGDIYLVNNGSLGHDVYPGSVSPRADVITHSEIPSTQIVLTSDNYDVTGAIRKGRRSDYSELNRTLCIQFLSCVKLGSQQRVERLQSVTEVIVVGLVMCGRVSVSLPLSPLRPHLFSVKLTWLVHNIL